MDFNFITENLKEKIEKPKYFSEVDRKVKNPKISEDLDKDIKRMNYGRDMTYGFPISQYIQSVPLLFTRDNHNLWLGDTYKGKSCFIILNGGYFPKLLGEFSRKHDMSCKRMLESPGFVTMTIDESINLYRSDMWVSVEEPKKFVNSTYQDPKIQKFIPKEYQERIVKEYSIDGSEEFRVGDYPNISYFLRNNFFNENQFLYESNFYGDYSLLVAIKILYYLGCRKIYLLGYEIDKNNEKELKLMEKLNSLKSHFIKNDLYVYNCGEENHLLEYDRVTYDEAWAQATSRITNLKIEKSKKSKIIKDSYKGKRKPANIYNKWGDRVNLVGQYEGQDAFLVLSGPSFLQQLNQKIVIRGKEYNGRELLNMPGVITMGVNNSPKTFRPNLWVMGDDVKSFMKSIWLDPNITKFIPKSKYRHKLFDNDPEVWQEMKTKVFDCPSVFGFDRNEHFNPDTFLETDTINWGEHTDSTCALGIKSKRSVMMLAMRLLHVLGFKNVYLLGCDFKMDENIKYSFEQDRNKGSITNNNKIYDALNKRFASLKSRFEDTDFHVYNCYKESGLTCFEYKPFEECISEVLNKFPDTDTENSFGLYDRKANQVKLQK